MNNGSNENCIYYLIYIIYSYNIKYCNYKRSSLENVWSLSFIKHRAWFISFIHYNRHYNIKCIPILWCCSVEKCALALYNQRNLTFPDICEKKMNSLKKKALNKLLLYKLQYSLFIFGDDLNWNASQFMMIKSLTAIIMQNLSNTAAEVTKY